MKQVAQLCKHVFTVDSVGPVIAGPIQVLFRLSRIELVGLDVRIRVLGSFKKGLLTKILIEHQVAVQSLEVEQVLHRLAEVLVPENRRLEVHMHAVDTRGHIDKDSGAAQPAFLHGIKRVSLVPRPCCVFHQHIQFAKTEKIQVSFR